MPGVKVLRAQLQAPLHAGQLVVGIPRRIGVHRSGPVHDVTEEQTAGRLVVNGDVTTRVPGRVQHPQASSADPHLVPILQLPVERERSRPVALDLPRIGQQRLRSATPKSWATSSGVVSGPARALPAGRLPSVSRRRTLRSSH